MARPSHLEARLAELLPELTRFALNLVKGNTIKADAAVSDAYVALIHELREQPSTRLKRLKHLKRRAEPLIFPDDDAFANWCRARVGTIASKRYATNEGDILAREGALNDAKFRAKVRQYQTRCGRKVRPQGHGPDEHIETGMWIESLYGRENDPDYIR